MTNIEQAIIKIQDVTKIKCGPEFSHHYAVDLNDYRAEIVALMRDMLDMSGTAICCPEYLMGESHNLDCKLAALAAKILEAGK